MKLGIHNCDSLPRLQESVLVVQIILITDNQCSVVQISRWLSNLINTYLTWKEIVFLWQTTKSMGLALRFFLVCLCTYILYITTAACGFIYLVLREIVIFYNHIIRLILLTSKSIPLVLLSNTLLPLQKQQCPNSPKHLTFGCRPKPTNSVLTFGLNASLNTYP